MNGQSKLTYFAFKNKESKWGNYPSWFH